MPSGGDEIFQRRLIGFTLEKRNLTGRGTLGDKVCAGALEDACCIPESGESGSDSGEEDSGGDGGFIDLGADCGEGSDAIPSRLYVTFSGDLAGLGTLPLDFDYAAFPFNTRWGWVGSRSVGSCVVTHMYLTFSSQCKFWFVMYTTDLAHQWSWKGTNVLVMGAVPSSFSPFTYEGLNSAGNPTPANTFDTGGLTCAGDTANSGITVSA